MLAVIHSIPEMVDASIIARFDAAVQGLLTEAATCDLHDGNVNHPLAAYATLVLGGERLSHPWAVDLGYRRLQSFCDRIGEHRSRRLRQAEMSEYNSLTYTALDIWFLALIAEYSRTDRVRNLARFLEERLWVDVAMHFHAPTQQFAGPHSRSYADDSMGGCSALHFTMLAAFDDHVFIQPELCYTYHHPSTLVQNSLVALLPYHVPPLAKRIAWDKPFPYEFTKTTYAESYHENSRREEPGVPAQNAPFAFDEDVYPGGWSDLTTYMTEDYTLGSASLPYVNAGHSDSLMMRIRRAGEIRALTDFRSGFTRGVFNGSRPGKRNFCHVARTSIDESYLYEEGRSAIYQHRNKALICYSPKRAGHRGITSFRLDMLFTYHAPFDMFVVNNVPVHDLPVVCRSESRICFRDFRTYGLLIPLQASPSPALAPVHIWRCGDYLVVSAYNYDGPTMNVERHALNMWWTGFILELASSDEMSWDQFLQRADLARVEQRVHDGVLRTVRFTSAGDAMAFTYDPIKEVILSRRWNDVEDEETHFRVIAGKQTTGPFCPPTLFGREVMS
jgi:hypothetical protein